MWRVAFWERECGLGKKDAKLRVWMGGGKILVPGGKSGLVFVTIPIVLRLTSETLS